MNDRELLELAAKAAGINYIKPHEDYNGSLGLEIGGNPMRTKNWNPLTDDGDALRLAVKLRIDVTFNELDVFAFPPNGNEGESETINVSDPYAATRRTIVRAAAEIGKGATMNKLDLIVDALEMAENKVESAYVAIHIDEALTAARELRDMKPVCYGYKGLNDEIMDCAVARDDEYCIPLYALGESND